MAITGKKIDWVAYDEAASLSDDIWVFKTFDASRKTTTSTAIPASTEPSDLDLGKALGLIENEDHTNDAAVIPKLFGKPDEVELFKAQILMRVSEIIAKRDARIDQLSQRIVDLEQKLDLLLAIENNENFGAF